MTIAAGQLRLPSRQRDKHRPPCHHETCKFSARFLSCEALNPIRRQEIGNRCWHSFVAGSTATSVRGRSPQVGTVFRTFVAPVRQSTTVGTGFASVEETRPILRLISSPSVHRP